MRKQSTRTSRRTAGLGLLLLGVIVALPSQPVQATDCATLPPPTSIEVTKTASLTAGAVEGTISITNVGKNPACISLIIDTLEVHFPESSKWVQVALVPGLQAIPNPIPVGQTVVIDYNFDTCDANDYTGANSMRNVVKVTLANGAKGEIVLVRESGALKILKLDGS